MEAPFPPSPTRPQTISASKSTSNLSVSFFSSLHDPIPRKGSGSTPRHEGTKKLPQTQQSGHAPMSGPTKKQEYHAGSDAECPVKKDPADVGEVISGLSSPHRIVNGPRYWPRTQKFVVRGNKYLFS